MKIILVGSSIFANWARAANMLPHYRLINRAIGGTVTADWIDLLPDILTTESPSAVLYYAGSNDLNREILPDRILANVWQYRQIIRSMLPTAKFAYFGIMKAPQKAGKWPQIDHLNQRISASLLPGDIYVETNDIFSEWRSHKIIIYGR